MKVLKTDGRFRIFNKIEINDELAVGNYRFNYDAFGVPYLEELSEFAFPAKLYDIDKKFRETVIKSYHHSKNGIGVLLEGYKGQGKTVTAKLLCQEVKLPVILMDKPIPKNVDFVGFLSRIEQDFVLFVDEFEKNFEKWGSLDEEGSGGNSMHKQDSFLSFMDGATTTNYKKLFVFTTNESVNDKLVNRPSRIMWHKKYQFMPKEFFDMVVTDKLVNKEWKDDLELNLPLSEATVDLLLTIIDQVNLFDVPYSSFKNIFNHTVRNIKYKVFLKVKDKWQYMTDMALTSMPTREERYIGNLGVTTIDSINEDEVVFTSHYKCNNFPKKLEDLEGEKVWTYRFERVPEFKEVFAV